MGLLSFLQRKASHATAGQDTGSGEAARGRARRRLIGATVLVLLGVIGLPMLFDTAPRPLPVDIPIDIPRKDAVPPLAAKPSAVAPKPPSAAKTDPVVTEKPVDAARETQAAEPASPPVAKLPEKAQEKTPEKAAERATAPSRDLAAEAARAQAALEGRPADAVITRFVVQVGAFSEPDSAREVRAKVEKLGLKTYTQVVETSGGKRIRVRVGPYNDRAEAEKIAAQIKQAGVNSAVLTL